MPDVAVGRVLVASLHQAIADLLVDRLEFYESWLSPAGLRHGRIGLAPLGAVLSFLRREGEPYEHVTARAGEYAAEWVEGELSSFQRALIRLAPRWLRVRLVMRVVSRMIHDTYDGCRVRVRSVRPGTVIEIRGSIFCGVRTRAEQPLCGYYVAAVQRLMELCGVTVHVSAAECRATGSGQCLMTVEAISSRVDGTERQAAVLH